MPSERETAVQPRKPEGLLYRLTGIRPGYREDLLPEATRAQISRSARSAEKLVGLVQLGIVALFALLYFAAPKTFTEDAPFAPIPWVLGGYTAFTLLRLAISYRMRLPVPVAIMSALADILILYVAIWSFHLQYEQPAAFYLKAPTLLYVFIFIALRALSFSPRYLLVSGFAAAFGWLVLVGYAVLSGDGREMVTRDYVEYMTSATILIGAEIDKVISIIVVTLILAIAAARSRALLFNAVAEQTAADNLSRFLEPNVAQSLRSGEQLPEIGQGVEQEAAVLFIDLRGFTALAATLSPRELIALLGRYQSLVVPIVHSCNGSVTTFLGDGIMVTFGAVRPSTTYAADAFRCTHELLAGVSAWSEERRRGGLSEIRVGIGVEVGQVVCGPIGDVERIEYAVVGDTVNRAAKLQNHTKRENVAALASAKAYQRALEHGYDSTVDLTALPASQVEGIAANVDLVVIEQGQGG